MQAPKTNKNIEGAKPNNHLIRKPLVQKKEQEFSGVNTKVHSSILGRKVIFGTKRSQAKLKVGSPNDKFEKEADSTADKIVNKTSGGSDAIQKKATEEEQVQQKPIASEISAVQKKDLSEEADVQRQEKGTESDEEALQTKASAASQLKSANSIEPKLNATKGNGQKLGGKAKQEMEAGFGADFSNVKIHTDTKAAEMSDQIGAQAFTHGNDVYFNHGKYDPETLKGKHLLAHELTHTIQQSGMVQKKDDENIPSNNLANSNKPEFNLEIGFNAFIPNTLNAPVHQNNKAWKREPNPFSGKLFSSDNRSYSQNGTSRIWQKGEMKFKGEDLIHRISSQGVGASEQADPVYKIIGMTPIHYGSDTGGNPIKKIVGITNIKSKTAPDKGSVTKIERSGMKGFNFVGEASYPFSSMAPDIDFNISALMKVFKKGDNYYVMAILQGVRDSFPAYQAYISSGGTKNYFYTYRVGKNDGPGLINLNSQQFIVASQLLKL